MLLLIGPKGSLSLLTCPHKCLFLIRTSLTFIGLNVNSFGSTNLFNSNSSSLSVSIFPKLCYCLILKSNNFFA